MILFIYFVSYFYKIVKNNNGKVGMRNNNTILMLSEPSYFIGYNLTEKRPAMEWLCTVFTLRNNNYNWWLPKTGIQFILSRQLPAVFHLPREIIIEVRNKYFKYDGQLSFEENFHNHSIASRLESNYTQ